LVKACAHGGQVGDLAADVAGHADRIEIGVVAGVGVEARGLGERDAELVLGLAGGDLGVTAGRDVRIDPEGHLGLHAQFGGDLGDQVQLGLGLDIDLGDAGLQGELDLATGLADAGEDDALAGDAGGQGAAHLALGHVSAPAPRSPSTFSTATLELAFTA
jgi:hypothetical protein